MKSSGEGLHYPLTWSNGFSRGRGKRGALVEKDMGPWQRNDVKINFNEFFWGKEDEDKRMVKLAFYFQNFPFWTYIKKNQHVHF